MARKLPDSYHSNKKKMKLDRLTERYYGKLDLLSAWENIPDHDVDYLRDLKRRVRGHRADILYRSGEEPA